ncbi:MFS transporter [Paracoccaceae bacterium]|nr:MFS transporter [Paracoccaceae bacterium]
MAQNALSKLVAVFKTQQHDYEIDTDLFGRLDTDKIAKDLNLETLGQEKGEKNQPSPSSRIGDEVEGKIKERISADQSHAYEIAENQIQTYNERVSNLDFEGHLSELRSIGPIAISDIRSQIQLGLNEMHTSRRKLLDVEKEYAFFRKKNCVENRTAKVTTSTRAFIGVLIVLIMLVAETYINAIFLAGGNERGLFGGIIEAAAFSLLNIGFSIIVTVYIIKQIAKPFIFWKLIGLIGITAWITIVLFLNLALAHYKEAAIYVFEDGGKGVLESLLNSPLGLTDPQSWILFAMGILFATITLTDIITFSDILPGYSKVQEKWDEHQLDYKAEFQESLENLEAIKEEYRDNLKNIGDDLSIRFRELDKILRSRARISSLYENHDRHLQASAEVLFSCYYEANKASRTKKEPDRFNQNLVLDRMELTTAGGFQEREAQRIKKRIADARKVLAEQIEKVLEEVLKGIGQYNNLDQLGADQLNEKEETAQ